MRKLTDFKNKTLNKNIIYDSLGRPLNYLRISVTDKCNFNCTYCKPFKTSQSNNFLSTNEIHRLSRIFCSIGVNKIRLTGGEPLLRKDLPEIIYGLKAINNLSDLAITTNGFYLQEMAEKLKHAGLNRINVSLDSCKEKTFSSITGQKNSFNKVLNGIKEAQNVGFNDIKINVVLLKETNCYDIIDFINNFKNSSFTIRFIEQMDFSNKNNINDNHLNNEQLKIAINQYFPLQITENNLNEPAQYYNFKDGTGKIGFISPITKPFCKNCSKLRLTSDGKLLKCLFSNESINLRSLLHEGINDKQIKETLINLWTKRNNKINSGNDYSNKRMFKIGG